MHVTIGVIKKIPVAGTEVVKTELAVRRFDETILGALAIAGKEEPALAAAIAGQSDTLVLPKFALLFRFYQLDHWLLHDVS